MQMRISLGRCARTWTVALVLGTALAACGGGGGNSTTPVGTGSNASGSIALAASAQTLAPLGTSTITATLGGTIATGTVTWTLSGNGSLTGATGTTVTYVAPATFDGAQNAVITATSATDSTLFASIAVLVNGEPVLTVPTTYPANLNVAYSASPSVSGGTSPYTWSVPSGSLPTGLTFGTSTTNTNTITGTPTALGTYTATIRVVDAAGRTRDGTYTLQVRPQNSCAMEGEYAALLAGHAGDVFALRAAHYKVDSEGKITGIEDFAISGTTKLGANLTSGTCKTTAFNFGVLTTASDAGSTSINYATLKPLGDARLHQLDNSGVRVTGPATLVTAPLTSQPTGSFAFGMTGVDAQNLPVSIAGRVTLDANGAVTDGRADVVGAAAKTATAVTGSFAAASNGRGTGTLSIGGTTYAIVHYVTTADRYYLISAASSGPRLAGFLTRQATPGAFAASSLASPAVLSVWANSGSGATGRAITSLGRIANGTATTVDLDVDVATEATQSRAQLTAVPLTIEADGRAVVAPANGSRRYVIYLDGPSNGYAVETTSPGNGFGLLEKQAATLYTNTDVAAFVAGTQFGEAHSTLLLAPNLILASGSMSNPVSASYAFDANGRGTAVTSTNYFGGTVLVMYAVSADRIVVMGTGGTSRTPTGSAISWLGR